MLFFSGLISGKAILFFLFYFVLFYFFAKVFFIIIIYLFIFLLTRNSRFKFGVFFFAKVAIVLYDVFSAFAHPYMLL